MRKIAAIIFNGECLRKTFTVIFFQAEGETFLGYITINEMKGFLLFREILFCVF